MKKTLNKIISIIGWLVLLFAFSSIGFATDNPALGVPLYLIFFLVVFAGVYLYVSKSKHTQENVVNKKTVIPRVFGIIILVISLFTPWFVFSKINLTSGTYIIITLITAAMIFMAFIAVRLINKAGSKIALKIVGYLILVLIAAIPAIAALNYLLQFFNRPYDALGTAYWCIVAITVLAWWGFSLIGKKS